MSAEHFELYGNILEHCETLPGLMKKAVSHRDACSPFLPGRRAAPRAHRGESLAIFENSDALVLLARNAQDKGRALDAAELLLDGIRWSHDMRRGGAGVILSVLGAVLAAQAGFELERAIDHLSAEELESVGKELDVLLATQPHPSAMHAGEWLQIQMDVLLAVPGKDDWPTPGHTMEILPQYERPDFSYMGGHAREVTVLVGQAHRELQRRYEEHCPEDSSWLECVRAGRSVAAWMLALPEGETEDLIELLIRGPSFATRSHYRGKLVEYFTAGTPPLFKYDAKLVESRIRLHALRMKVASVLSRNAGGPCPLAPSVAEPELLPVVQSEGDTHLLVPPTWFEALYEPPQAALAVEKKKGGQSVPKRRRQREPKVRFLARVDCSVR